MTKRQMWYVNCLLWGGIWFVFGVIFPLFWVFTVLSLMAMLLPVGMPTTRPTDQHNPNEWNKHGN